MAYRYYNKYYSEVFIVANKKDTALGKVIKVLAERELEKDVSARFVNDNLESLAMSFLNILDNDESDNCLLRYENTALNKKIEKLEKALEEKEKEIKDLSKDKYEAEAERNCLKRNLSSKKAEYRAEYKEATEMFKNELLSEQEEKLARRLAEQEQRLVGQK